MKRIKRQSRSVGVLFISFVLAMGLTILFSHTAASAGESFKGRYSYHWFPAHHLAIYSEKFVQLCKEETQGRLDITSFPSGQLYSVRDAIAAVSQGSVEMAGVVALTLAPAAPDFGLDTLMMLFDSYEQQRKAWETEPGKAVIAKVEQKLGVKLLCRFPNGPACGFTSGKKVQKLDDFKGLKARLVSPSEKPFWEALEASAVSMGTEQVYSAFQQGMVNAIWTVPSAIKAYSWWDLVKYCTLPFTLYPDSFLVVNAKWWASLSQDVKEIVLRKVVPRIEKDSTDFVMEDAKANLDEFVKQKGGTITTLSPQDVKTLKEICVEKVYPPLVAKYDPAFWTAVAKQQGLKK